jgi:hypothetical protein
MPKQILDLINIPEADLTPDLLDRPKITSRDGRAFILEKWERRKRSRNSWINAYGSWLVQVVNNSLGPSWWCCSRCFETLYSGKATTSAAGHLNTNHSIYEDSVQEEGEPPAKKQRSVADLQQAGYSINNLPSPPIRILVPAALVLLT